ncbi:MAG: hypothetical protein IPG22_13820 [Acidobacteria bacterium]|nr:hypothetical protein [Acidobacteriota bacterium]
MASSKKKAEGDQSESLRTLGYSDERQAKIVEVLDRPETDSLEEAFLLLATERQIAEIFSDKFLEALVEMPGSRDANLSRLFALLSKLNELFDFYCVKPSAPLLVFHYIDLQTIRNIESLESPSKAVAEARYLRWIKIMWDWRDRICVELLKRKHGGLSLSVRLKDVQRFRSLYNFDSDKLEEYERVLQNMDHFDVLLEQLEAIPDIRTKMAKILEEKSVWERKFNSHSETSDSETSFGRKCDIEMAKYERLLLLQTEPDERPDVTIGGSHDSEPDQMKRRVIILLIEELIPKFSEMSVAKQSEFLALLTGRSKKGFELIIPDHRRAENFKDTQREASEWISRLK